MRILLVAMAAATASAALAQAPQELAKNVATLRGSVSTVIPPADSFTTGDRRIPAGTVVNGSVGVSAGSLDVFGKIAGSATVFGGDLRVHKGAEITGDAISVGGQIIADSGSIDGERMALSDASALSTVVAKRDVARPSTLASMRLVGAWFGVLLVLGIGILVFAERNLDGVVTALEQGLMRAFFVGLLGQVLALPALVILCVALAITIIGLLLIQFAVVAYVVALLGLVTLGFMAVARLTGAALTADSGLASPRGVHLRGLVLGLVIYVGLWLVAAMFTSSPFISSMLRGLAFVVTWVVATVGFGATVISRAGTRRRWRESQPSPIDDISWQTPTPVSGVAAARRPVSVSQPR